MSQNPLSKCYKYRQPLSVSPILLFGGEDALAMPVSVAYFDNKQKKTSISLQLSNYGLISRNNQVKNT